MLLYKVEKLTMKENAQGHSAYKPITDRQSSQTIHKLLISYLLGVDL